MTGMEAVERIKKLDNMIEDLQSILEDGEYHSATENLLQHQKVQLTKEREELTKKLKAIQI